MHDRRLDKSSASLLTYLWLLQSPLAPSISLFHSVLTPSNPLAMASYAPILLQHVNLPVPDGTLGLATEFYGEVIGFKSDPVPQLQRDSLLWWVVL